MEFIQRGRPSTRSVDIVPLKWLQVNKKSVEVKFKPPPYSDEDFEEIQTLVENNVDAPQSWLLYKVRIVARGKTYVYALKKLKIVNDKRFAFTSESEIDPEEKSAMIEQKLKSKMPQNNVSVLKDIMNVKKMCNNEKNISDFTIKKGMKRKNIATLSVSKRPEVGTSNIGHIPDENEDTELGNLKHMSNQHTSIDDQFLNGGGININQDMLVSDINSVMLDAFILPIESPKDGKVINTPEDLDLRLIQKMDNNEIPKMNVKKVKKNNTVISSITTFDVMKKLEEISATQDQLLENQGMILNILEASGFIQDNVARIGSFEDKYNLELPLKTVNEFDNFNQQLKDPTCHKNFVASLYCLIGKRSQYAKTINNILKKFIARDVALMYTAQKQTAEKLILKSTVFCKTLLAVVLSKHTNESNGELTEKDVLATLGTCLTNAKDWDGFRLKRNKP